MKSLSHTLMLLDAIAATSGKAKVELFGKTLAHDATFEKVVRYAMDPFTVFNIKKLPSPSKHGSGKGLFDLGEDVFPLLDAVAEKGSATSAEKQAISDAANVDNDTWEVIRRIVNKDLRCGIGAKTVRKFLPDFPVHDIALCGTRLVICPDPKHPRAKAITDMSELPKYTKSLRHELQHIAVSTKLDGVRVWAVVQRSGRVSYLSRNGKTFKNFGIFDKDLAPIAEFLNREAGVAYPVVLDGEVVSSNANFNKLMTQVQRIDEVDVSTLKFCVFDVPFIEGNLAYRYRFIQRIKNGRVTFLEHVDLPNFDDVEATIKDLFRKAQKEGHEGLVLKSWIEPYSFSRSNAWCKVVSIWSEDLKVVGFKMGTGKYEGMLGALTVDYKGTHVDIGGGYSDDERIAFLKKQPKVIEVHFREATEDGSLRFPRYYRVRDDKD